ncbi:ATP-binding protein [Planktothricoides raciborskii]|uniref:histidine kinase n=1 Tax=Planktothricoides raciborskii GIHE-MW2 TaxID=2792601 RepID=A0AAU8JBK1_9CYAN
MINSKILVVEDEMLVAEDIAGRLRRLGYEVTDIVESGEEAILSVLNNPPDLVLMDIVLAGDMDGIETAETIRQHKQIPIVYLTAYGDKKTLNRSKTTDPYGYVVKPFDEQQLNTTIEIALNKYQAEDKIRKSLADSESARKLAEEIVELKNQYISMISHELRQPISQILLSAETLELSHEKFDDRKKAQYLQFIQNAAENMEEMVRDMLFLGRSESGHFQVKRQIINLEIFCQNLIKQLQISPDQSPAQESQIILAIAPDISSHLLLDKQLLDRILTNLLSNAIKYSPDGGNISLVFYLEKVATTADFSSLINPDYSHKNSIYEQLIIQVQDSGIGIPEADIERLFEPFHRCSNVQQIKGNGLGLSIVKKAVELQGGKISVQSEVGLGTTFTVSLPLIRG